MPMVGSSWTHKLVHVLVKPLADTWVTPNHVTTLRLVTGLAACAAFAVGERDWDIWGGWLWLVSALLDRADGELARISGKISRFGHVYDMICDTGTTALFFLAAGIGLRVSGLGDWAIVAGVMGGAGVLAAEILAEVIDRQNADTGEKAYPGFAGFDFDDVLYLFAPIMWLGWQMPFVVGAAIGAPAFALLTWYRLCRSRRRQASRATAP